MQLFKNIWHDLKFSTSHSLQSLASGVGYIWTNGDTIGDVQFKSKPASKSVAARAAQQTIMQMTEAEVNKIIPRIHKEFAQQMLDDVQRRNKDNSYATLIQKGRKTVIDEGNLVTTDGQRFIPRDYLSRIVSESLFVKYEGDETITYTLPAISSETYAVETRNLLKQLVGTQRTIKRTPESSIPSTDIKTKDVIHYDLAPQVSLSTNKNLILTQVQGRDFTRKELISNGDLTFSVRGSVVSDTPGVYPTAAVNRLIKIAQHKGLLDVKHFMFEQFNVKQVIIKDFNLDTQEFKNIQPYSFTCVAVEANDIEVITKDTIGHVNQIIEESPINKWYNLILNNKLAELATNTVTTAANSALSKGLDIEGMVTNI